MRDVVYMLKKLTYSIVVIITVILVVLVGSHSQTISDNLFSESSAYVPPDKIVMIWDYIGIQDDNQIPQKRIAHVGLDVIAPTWFAIEGENGYVSSLADEGYVKRAHKSETEVWAVFENRSDTMLTYGVLSNSDAREKAVNAVTDYAILYGIDGINVDFEAMSGQTLCFFYEMITELYEKLKPHGICLSIDISYPTDYDLSLLEKNADYIVLMAYDQHHANSTEIGPVAAIDWVKEAIEYTLEYVTPDKVILGIPFYTRIWVESSENGTFITSESDGMKSAYERFSMLSTVWFREDQTEQIYAEYEGEGKLFKVWLEDEHSLSLKLDTINDYELAGLSAWRRGLELPEIWELINAYFK